MKTLIRLIGVVIFFLFAEFAQAKYVGPLIVVTIPVGPGVEEFNFPPDQEDANWFVNFFVIDGGRIAILDNRNVKIFNNGIYDRSFNIDPEMSVNFSASFFDTGVYSYRKDLSSDAYMLYVYSYSGDIVMEFGKNDVDMGFFEYVENDGTFIVQKNTKYNMYDKYGVLINESDRYPLQRGGLEHGSDNIEFEYEGKSYEYKFADVSQVLPSKLENKFYLTGIKKLYLVDYCGKQLGEVEIPKDVVFKSDALDAYERQDFVHDKYGTPLRDKNGNVYTWKTMPTHFSILKWVWVDSPDDPQPGPDAPANLTVQPSIDGLYLTWGASPQDPGCVDGYEVERSTSAGGIYTSVKTTDPGVLKFNDIGALPGSTYFYKVRAKSGSTYSPYTAEMSGTR